MKRVGVMCGVVLGLVALAAPAWSDDIYQWTDADGSVHYSNTPTSGVSSTRVPNVAPSVAEPAAAPGSGGAAAAADADTLTTDASLRRNALERDLRATQKRLRDLDARLAALGRARNQNARGSAATGGVGAPALDVRSDEERALATEREQLVKHADEVRSEATRLREEVTAREGATPAWWNDLR